MLCPQMVRLGFFLLSPMEYGHHFSVKGPILPNSCTRGEDNPSEKALLGTLGIEPRPPASASSILPLGLSSSVNNDLLNVSDTEKKPKGVTHKVIECVHKLGDVQDPLTGKPVVVDRYRDEVSFGLNGDAPVVCPA